MTKHKGVPVHEWKPLGDAHLFNQANDQAEATDTDSAPRDDGHEVQDLLAKGLAANAVNTGFFGGGGH